MITKKLKNSKRFISYWEKESANPDKCFILLSPGFRGGEFFNVCEKFFPANYRLIAPDYPGRGDTDPLDHVCESVKEVAEDIYILINKLGLNNVTLLGISFGTMVINELVTNYKLNVENIILITPGEYFRLPRRLILSSFMYPAKYSTKTRQLYKVILSKSLNRFKILPDKHLQSLVEQFFLAANYRVPNHNSINIPTTFVIASRDGYVRPGSVAKLRKLYPNRKEIRIDAIHRLNTAQIQEAIKLSIDQKS